MATEEQQPAAACPPCHSASPIGTNGGYSYKVGYALKPTKVSSFIQPCLITHAQHRRIHLIPIQLHRPLIDQAPFHVIIHKLYTQDWIRQLEVYKSHHPDVIIIDSPSAIQRLHHRISMLDAVDHLPPPPPPCSLSFGIPNQVVIDHQMDYSLDKSFRFPAIIKPLLADGTANSHQLCIAFNSQALNNLKPPVVLQEFVNHGGFLFKVYVAGDHVRCVQRSSLPDIPPNFESPHDGNGILPFSQISNLPAPTTTAQHPQSEMPPLDFVHHIARGLSQELNLHLFNFDIIRDATHPTRYLVIDINYFPGYAKLPAFETMFTDFLLDLLPTRHPNELPDCDSSAASNVNQ